MKTMMVLVAIAAASLLAGCMPTEGSAVPNTPEDMEVRKILEIEGCSVFRFYDNSAYRYTTICPSGRSHVSWVERCGKGCTRTMVIETSAREI